MARIARTVIPDVPHHFTQRGNNRQQVFFRDADRCQYLAFLAEETAAHGLDLWADCLMANHVHLIGTPRDEGAAARAIGRTHFRYSSRSSAGRASRPDDFTALVRAEVNGNVGFADPTYRCPACSGFAETRQYRTGRF